MSTKMQVIVCPVCKEKVGIFKDNVCPHCGHNVKTLLKEEEVFTDINEQKKYWETKYKKKYSFNFWKNLLYVMGAMMIITTLRIVCNNNSNTVDVDKVLKETADAINKDCPRMMDSNTRLDNAINLSNKQLQFNYTIVTYSKDELNIDNVKEAMRPNIINGLKTIPGSENFSKYNVTVIFSYRDKDGVFLFNLKFGPEDYK